MAGERPRNAPYLVDVGEPVEISVVETEDAPGLVAEFEFRGDRFGGAVYVEDVGEPGSMGHTTAVDELVSSIARVAWHELGLTPTFREEDAKWTGRVEVQRPWERELRRPTMGWLVNEDEVLGDGEVVPEPEPTAEAVHSEPVTVESMDDVEREFGRSATVTMTPEEMQQVARGEVPESFLARVNRQRPDYELLDEIEAVLEIAHGEVISEQKIATAYRALNELRRRSTGVGS